MNARFWIFHNLDWVKITLRPGQKIEFCHFEHTDEGFASSADRYENCGDFLLHSWMHDGRDCDGRHSDSGERECRMDMLEADFTWDETVDVRLPLWSKVESRQYDQFAEAAGY